MGLPIPEMVRHMNRSLARLVRPETKVIPDIYLDPQMHCTVSVTTCREIGKFTEENLDWRFSRYFSKKRTRSKRAPSKPEVPTITVESPRSPRRHSTAPPGCGSEGPQPPPGGPADLLVLCSEAAGQTLPPSRPNSRAELSARGAKGRRPSDDSCSTMDPASVDMDRKALHVLAEEEEEDPRTLEERGTEKDRPSLTRPKRVCIPKSTLDRPPGWLSSLAEETPEHLKVVPVVPAAPAARQVGDLRLGPPPSRTGLVIGTQEVLQESGQHTPL